MYRPPADPAVPAASIPYRIVAAAVFGLMDLQRWRFDVDGAEHLPERGGAVIAANHTSYWDFFTTARPSYERHGRPARILAKESLFRVPGFGRLMDHAGHVPVHRRAGAAAFSSAVTALQRGELLLVLPEQTISASLELLPFKTGAARMAGTAGVPLIPAVSWGTHRFHTLGHWPRPRWRLPVHVRYGPALRPTAEDDPVAVTARLREAVAGLLDETRRAYPGS